ncbi:MAG: hypothetical protein LBE55_03440 [Clostridiales bacterium]|jgi:hypothetical protein|nr:hypothetical protein [Clostridiales bacterium]
MEMEEAKMDIFTDVGRSYPRSGSGARARYGRAGRPSTARGGGYARRSGASEKTAPRYSFRQRIVFQATICGGFLAVLLFFNIVDTGFTNSVTGWIDRNISYDMLAEEGGIGGWVNSVMGIFGNDAEDEAPYYEVLYEDAGAGVFPEQTEMPQANTIDSSRIDENILREIETMVDVYYENN